MSTIESVLECGMTYEKLAEASKGRVMSFVVGGLIIGAVVLLATSK
jgi:hypothetical protein